MNLSFLRTPWCAPVGQRAPALRFAFATLLRSARRAILSLLLVAGVVAAPNAFAQQADLSLLKYGPDTSSSGANVTYNVTLLNVGPGNADTISLTEPIASGMTFVSFTQTTGPAMACTMPAVGAGGSVDCTLPALALGATVTYDLTLHIEASVAPGTALMSIATVSMASSTVTDENIENDAGVAGTYIPDAASADLSISKVSLPTVAANGNLVYTIAVSNAGPNAASTVNFTDNLPSGLNFVALQQTSGPSFSCTTPTVGSNGTVSCDLASFGVGTAVFALTVSVNLISGIIFENQVAVSSATFDASDEGNLARMTVRVESADLTLTAAAPASVALGSTISYQLTITNGGPDVARFVVLNDVLPAGTTFVSISQDNGPSFNCSYPGAGATGAVTCTASLLATGASAQFTVVVNALTAGNTSNTATASAESADPNPSGIFGASATAATNVVAPPTVSMAFAPTVIAPGQQSILTFTLANPAANSVALAGVGISNSLPAGLAVASATVAACGGTVTTTAPGSIALTGATIAVGGTCQFSVNVTPAAAGIYAATSGAVSSSNGGTGGTANATLAVAVAPVIAQTIAPSVILVGATTTLTLTLSNSNPVALAGAGFTDTLPTGLAVAAVPGISNSCGGVVTANAGGNALSLSGATLAPNAVCTVSVQLQGVAAGTWTNGATITVAGLGNGNTASAVVTVYIVVPTLNNFGLLLLTGLLLVVAGTVLRRRRAQTSA